MFLSYSLIRISGKGMLGGDKKMTLTLACKDIDIGSQCPYIARGETEEELMEDAIKHTKEVHGYTDEQLNDPEMMKKVKAATKEE